jgi:hypothetical protein
MIDRELIETRIKEHKAAQEQALAHANAHAGAVQALERLRDDLLAAEMGAPTEGAPMEKVSL